MARLEVENPTGTTDVIPREASTPEASTSDDSPAAVQGFTVYDALLLGVVITWGANPAALKWALQYMEPVAFNAIRFLLATLVPVGILLASREEFRWQRGDGPTLLALGLAGHGFYQVTFIIALNLTLAGNAALILSINPAFVALFSALLGYERIRSYTWAGVALTLAGVGLVVLGSGEKFELGSQLLGDVLIVVVTMVWALYTVFSQKLLKRYSPVKLNALTMPVGSLVLLVAAAPSLASAAPTLTELPALFWLILAASGLLAVSAAYIIWYSGVQKLGATRTAVYSNLVPVLAAFFSFFVLGEQLGWQFWVGMALVLAGVSLARFGGRLFRRWKSEVRG
jgi:drug/metabolite transporter (DMT)-like permease